MFNLSFIKSKNWREWLLEHGTQIVKGGMALLGLALFGNGVRWITRGLLKDQSAVTVSENSRDEHAVVADRSVVANSSATKALHNHAGLESQSIMGFSNIFGISESGIADGQIDFEDKLVADEIVVALNTASSLPQFSMLCSLSLFAGAGITLSTGNPLFLAMSLGCLPVAQADFDCTAIRRKYDESIQYHYSCAPDRIVGNQTEISRVTTKYEEDIKPVDNCEELGQADCTGLYNITRDCGLSEEKALIFLMDRANRGVQRCENIFDAAVTSLYFTGVINQKTLSGLDALTSNFSSHLTDYLRLYQEYQKVSSRLVTAEQELEKVRNRQTTTQSAAESTAEWLVVIGTILFILGLLGAAEQLKSYAMLFDRRNKLKLGIKRLRSDLAKLFYELDNFYPVTGNWFFRFKTRSHGVFLKMAFFCNTKLEFAERLGGKECSTRSLFFEQEKHSDLFRRKEDDTEDFGDTSKDILVAFTVYKEKMYRLYVALNEIIHDARNAHFDQILELRDRYLRKTKNLREIAKHLRAIVRQFYLLIQLRQDKDNYQQQLEVIKYNISFYESQIVTLFAKDEKIPLASQRREITIASEVKEHAATLESLTGELNALKSKHEKLRVDYGDLVERHEQLKTGHHELEGAHEKLVETTQLGLRAADEKLTRTEKQVGAACSKLKIAHDALAETTQKDLKTEVKDQAVILEKLSGELRTLQSKHEKLQVDHSDLTKLHEQLKVEYQGLKAEHEKLVETTQLGLKTADEKLVDASGKLQVSIDRMVGKVEEVSNERIADVQKITTPPATSALSASAETAIAEAKERIMALEIKSDLLGKKHEELQRDYCSLAERHHELELSHQELIVSSKKSQETYGKLRKATVLMTKSVVERFEVADRKWEKMAVELDELRTAMHELTEEPVVSASLLASRAGFFAREDSSKRLDYHEMVGRLEGLVQTSGADITEDGAESSVTNAEKLEAADSDVMRRT